MQTYRDPPASAPLITAIGGDLFALDPEHGAQRWSLCLGRPIVRILALGPTVLAATRGAEDAPTEVHVIDGATGTLRSTIEAAFVVTVALASSERAYFAGPRGLLCLRSDGVPLWRALLEATTSSWTGDVYALVARDPGGRELWRHENATVDSHPLLLLGDLVAQPDLTS